MNVKPGQSFRNLNPLDLKFCFGCSAKTTAVNAAGLCRGCQARSEKLSKEERRRREARRKLSRRLDDLALSQQLREVWQ